MLTIFPLREVTYITFGNRWIGCGGPAMSPDLTPCDFWLWGMVKGRVYAARPAHINDLKERITTVIGSIPTKMVKTLRTCIENQRVQVERVQ